MKVIRIIQLLLLLTVIHICGCKPKSKPRIGQHSVIVLELDTFGFYKIPGESNPANIRFLAKKASAVIEGRMLKLGINDDQFQLSDTNNRVTFKFWQSEENKIPMERIRNLLQSSGKLGFWETYNAREVVPMLFPKQDSTKSDTAELTLKILSELLRVDLNRLNHTNFDAMIGYAYPKDTEKIDIILNKMNLPKDMHFLWSFKTEKQSGYVSLYAVKGTEPAMTNDVISDAAANQGNMGNQIDFTLNEAGTQKWKELTKANIDKDIAISFDDKVCVCPRVMSEIPNGKCQITRDYNLAEAKDLAALLSAGGMPLPLRIVQENIEN